MTAAKVCCCVLVNCGNGSADKVTEEEEEEAAAKPAGRTLRELRKAAKVATLSVVLNRAAVHEHHAVKPLGMSHSFRPGLVGSFSPLCLVHRQEGNRKERSSGTSGLGAG